MTTTLGKNDIWVCPICGSTAIRWHGHDTTKCMGCSHVGKDITFIMEVTR